MKKKPIEKMALWFIHCNRKQENGITTIFQKHEKTGGIMSAIPLMFFTIMIKQKLFSQTLIHLNKPIN